MYKGENFYAEQPPPPAFERNNIPVVIAPNNKYAPYAGVFIRSLLDHASEGNNYDIIILNQDISKENKRLLKNLVDCDKYVRKVDKEFFVIHHPGMEDRTRDLLDALGLSERGFDSYEEYCRRKDSIPPVNWRTVREKLARLREDSWGVLREICNLHERLQGEQG